ncbi:hydroxymethylbilane synthase [Parachlamydia sp. AcF125]|uniref:hydroxymethylbilane synthase n=1 Tax=Parachlamydia sp. AcF125 TaxID=2795736 RepID=UPI001BC99479|nr:hydroxymethylbilane synthase [Parachlamydia sp. AcF125]MBS4168065.1 Porphobilinogen deaminase [Parachlamydia sp. AcF125]
MLSLPKGVRVGARESPLSQAQVAEVQQALKCYHPLIELVPIWIQTTGDKEQKISLRSMEKTDFFTKEVDELLLSGQCDIAVHSAKDLPEPLPKGLTLIALTKGVDHRDALVLREGQTLDNLPLGALIATSSERREQQVRMLRPDLQFKDLRGTIGQRLSLLESGAADGVVVAEAALIRLGLSHLNRVYLSGETTPLQGRLAILARTGHVEMRQIFACLDAKSGQCLASFT